MWQVHAAAAEQSSAPCRHLGCSCNKLGGQLASTHQSQEQGRPPQWGQVLSRALTSASDQRSSTRRYINTVTSIEAAPASTTWSVRDPAEEAAV